MLMMYHELVQGQLAAQKKTMTDVARLLEAAPQARDYLIASN
jgi:hypothetical protein